MTYIIRLTRNTPDNLNFAIWRGQRSLDRGFVQWRVEGPDGGTLADGTQVERVRRVPSPHR